MADSTWSSFVYPYDKYSTQSLKVALSNDNMPKVKKESKIIHPNSRKALQLSRQQHRNVKLEKRKVELHHRQQAKLKKLKWFKENMNSEKSKYLAQEFKELIERYLMRFDEEQKKLELKNMKGRHIHERISHEYKVKFSVAKEKSDFNTGGLELPNLCDQETFEQLKKWNGEARFISLFPMTLIVRDSLDAAKTPS